MTEKDVPEFAIFQNSKTHRSAIWTKRHGWHECNREEYPAIMLMADLLRQSPDPTLTMQMIAELFLPPRGE